MIVATNPRLRVAIRPGLAVAAVLTVMACAHEKRPETGPAAVAALPAEAPAPALAIIHATLWTGDKRRMRIADGTLVLLGGRVAAVGGPEVVVPPGVTVVDARGRWVTPGIIDAHSHMGVYPTPRLPAHADGNEAIDPVTPEVQAVHSFWPQDPALSHASAAGVTALLVLPGSANLIGGRGFAVKNRPARSAEGMRFPGAPDALKMACGENPKRVYGEKRGPQTRMGNIAQVRAAYLKARDYAEKRRLWESKGKAKGEKAPERDLKLETLVEVMEGKLLVQHHCYRADEMLLMLDVARELGFTIRAYHHAIEAYKIAEVLAARGVGVATWADWWGFKMEGYDGIQENLGLVAAAGARAVVHSDSEIGVQHLPQHAAQGLAVAREAGLALTEDDALTWITINPAWMMGVEKQTGSLEPGKMADVVLWSHPPLSIYAKAELVLVDGHTVFDRRAGRRLSDFELGVVPEAGP